MSLRPRPLPWLGVLLALGAGTLLGCPGDRTKPEAAALLHALDELRRAPNPSKAAPLAKLQAVPCSEPEICQARDLCTEAFRHHVRGLELGSQLEAQVDAGVQDPADKQRAAALLLEMNVEIEEGRARMPDCEQNIARLRLRHKL